jgi:hypothetical protein
VPKAGDLKYSDERIDISDLNAIIEIDPERRICVAEAGVTFAHLVAATLMHGLAPIIVPELSSAAARLFPRVPPGGTWNRRASPAVTTSSRQRPSHVSRRRQATGRPAGLCVEIAEDVTGIRDRLHLVICALVEDAPEVAALARVARAGAVPAQPAASRRY